MDSLEVSSNESEKGEEEKKSIQEDQKKIRKASPQIYAMSKKTQRSRSRSLSKEKQMIANKDKEGDKIEQDQEKNKEFKKKIIKFFPDQKINKFQQLKFDLETEKFLNHDFAVKEKIQLHFNYFNECSRFKQIFLEQLSNLIPNPSIVIKIWCSWLITLLNMQEGSVHHLIINPQILEDENHKLLLQKLIESKIKKENTSSNQVTNFIQRIYTKNNNLYQKFAALKTENNNKILEHLSELISLQTEKSKVLKIVKANETKMIQLKCPTHILETLDKKFKSDNSLLKQFLIFETTFNYLHLSSTHQVDYTPSIMRYLKKINFSISLFSDPLISSLPFYYSLFEQDKYFGSLGRIQDIQLNLSIKGQIEVFPPFQEEVIENCANQILNLLDFAEENNQQLFFLCVIPWKDCMGYQLLEASDKLIKILTLEHTEYTFFNHLEQTSFSLKQKLFIFLISTSFAKTFWNEQKEDDLLTLLKQKSNPDNLLKKDD